MHALVLWMEYQLFTDADQWMVSVNSETMKCYQCARQQRVYAFEVLYQSAADLGGRTHEWPCVLCICSCLYAPVQTMTVEHIAGRAMCACSLLHPTSVASLATACKLCNFYRLLCRCNNPAPYIRESISLCLTCFAELCLIRVQATFHLA